MSTLTGSPIAAPDAGTPTVTPSRTATARKRRAGAPRDKRSVLLTVVMALLLVYSVLPLFWLLVNSTKTQEALFSSFGLWFSGDFAARPCWPRWPATAWRSSTSRARRPSSRWCWARWRSRAPPSPSRRSSCSASSA
jgi:ABC-type glycerol-3-phosphate transport system permease component